MKHYHAVLLLLFAGSFNTQADNSTDSEQQTRPLIVQVERDLEEWRHELLQNTISHAGTTIKPFTTDGCSGGMSDGWQHLARVLPAFAKQFGENPPWESCCETHDRAYWAGAMTGGFEKRRQADEALRQCVQEFGQSHSDEYSQRFGIDRRIIEQHFVITAELMYRAVRAGGQPCTLFPWRWGYGWPQCQENAEKQL